MATPSVLLVRPARVSRVHRVTPELFTLSCRLEGGETLPFLAGQWVYLHLLDASGQSVARGAFSIASAPSEGKPDLEFGIKVYGRLTMTFAGMREGDRIGVQGPFGLFTLPKEPAPLAFFAGGIGVTPFRSLVRQALDQGGTDPVALVWMNKAWDDLLYHDEFSAWEAASGGRFLYRPSLTRDPHPDWTGWRGRLDDAMLDALPLDWSRAVAYACGPVPFMDQARGLLEKRGLSGRSRVREERFS